MHSVWNEKYRFGLAVGFVNDMYPIGRLQVYGFWIVRCKWQSFVKNSARICAKQIIQKIKPNFQSLLKSSIDQFAD